MNLTQKKDQIHVDLEDLEEEFVDQLSSTISGFHRRIAAVPRLKPLLHLRMGSRSSAGPALLSLRRRQRYVSRFPKRSLRSLLPPALPPSLPLRPVPWPGQLVAPQPDLDFLDQCVAESRPINTNIIISLKSSAKRN